MADLTTRSGRRRLVEQAFAEGIETVAPVNAVREVLSQSADGIAVEGEAVPVVGKLVVVAIGKAAAPMAAATADLIGERVSCGYLLTKDGHLGGRLPGFESWEASHPVPDERGIDATRSILASVDGLGPDDVVLALISGGGSALFEAPAGSLTLDDIQRTTDLLLRAGAPIQHLNAVRSELSQVKGGGFRRHIGRARTVSLILSDVLGNPPDIIASGPTVRRRPDAAKALEILRRYELLGRIPDSVRHHLDRAASSTESPPEFDDEGDLFRIIGDNERFVSAIQRHFEDQGLHVDRIWREREGEAREQAVAWVDAVARSEADVILGGGEMTVTVRGDGTGGRNTEFALRAAIELHERELEATVASLASDGQDGGVDAAGAIVDGHTVADLRRAGVYANKALERNDSGSALARVATLVAPGPTGTNVNDVYIALRHGE